MPAGLTTAHEEFKGDPRVLAQYFHESGARSQGNTGSIGYQACWKFAAKPDCCTDRITQPW